MSGCRSGFLGFQCLRSNLCVGCALVVKEGRHYRYSAKITYSCIRVELGLHTVRHKEVDLLVTVLYRACPLANRIHYWHHLSYCMLILSIT